MAEYFPKPLDIQEDIKSLGLYQYWDSPLFVSLLDSQSKQLQVLQNTLQDMLTKVNIFDAEGLVLDDLGDVVQIPRLPSENDNTYRNRILAEISSKTGYGTPNDIISVSKSLTKATYCVYWEHYPANYVIEVNGASITDTLTTDLKTISPAAVGKFAVLSVMIDNVVFRPANLAYYVGDLVDNNDNNITNDFGYNLQVFYSTAENYDIEVYDTSYLPDVVEVLDAGDIYLVDNNKNLFITDNNDNITTGANPSYDDITLATTDGCLAEVYQYATDLYTEVEYCAKLYHFINCRLPLGGDATWINTWS